MDPFDGEVGGVLSIEQHRAQVRIVRVEDLKPRELTV